MDKTAIKNYAVAARRKLIEAVRQKAYQLYIFEDGALPPDEAYHKLRSDGIFLTPDQSRARERLCAYLALLSNDLDSEKAYQHVMEEVAYTWFNRLIALRFMEVNDYLPSGIRILSSMDKDRGEPDAMREAERLPYVNQDKITEYRAATGIDATEKLYKYILISQCNALSDILPGMFEKIDDYTELLLPDALYRKGGIVHDLVHAINEDDFRDQVQIIGWLYQYYISEKKDEVFAGLKKNIKINKETIPAATQLFTPEWIVKYMVENSLGRLWLERDRAESGLTNEYLNASYYDWKYYIDEAEQDEEVEKQLRELQRQYDIGNPTQIKIIDPCMGSGHILVYAFDVLYQIYVSQGYAEREIPNLILQYNIYGLDIDGRAAQLAYFALMMKARSYNRRFFRLENTPQPHVHAVIESDVVQRHHLDYMGLGMNEAERQQCRDDLIWLIGLFADAREYGSILKIDRALEYDRLRSFVKDIQFGQIDIYTEGMEQTERILLEILTVAEIMTQKYDVVVTNPPYMGSGGMGGKLSEYVKKNYPDSKSDIFAVFIEKCGEMVKTNGFQAMITQHAWMFLSSYGKLRERLLHRDIINMAHLGSRAFEEIGGEVVQTTTFVMRNCCVTDYKAIYIRLVDYNSQNAKEIAFLQSDNRFVANRESFEKIPGLPVAYWVGKNVFVAFENEKTLNALYPPKAGLSTADNYRFLRLWWEVEYTNICFIGTNAHELKVLSNDYKWFPMTKGSGYRKWYGNNEYILNYSNDGSELKYWLVNNPRDPSTTSYSRYIRNHDKYLKSGISFGDVASNPSFRSQTVGFIPNARGPYIYSDNSELLGYLNSKTVKYFLEIITPTMTFNVGDVSRTPYKQISSRQVVELVTQNISISRTDWDSFETSWDFQAHPLVLFHHDEEINQDNLLYADDLYNGVEIIEYGKSEAPIHLAFDSWERFTYEQFAKLKANEEELNRIFIEIYCLQDELTPEVEDKDVTIRKADLSRDIRSFISYAVGCMFGRYSLDEPGLVFAFGRYSLDEPGLVFAGGRFNMARYKTFLPEDDNILPIGASDYFDDDIVVRFVDFVRVVYGDATLDENLNFIADALYPNGGGSANVKIRRYFLGDFYKDHVKIYQKRPIYWLFDSGKKDGFKALIYLHRYDKFTVARVRTDYLHPLQRKYESEIGRLEMLSSITENAREKAAYRKEIESLQSKIEECRIYDQVVAHIAHQAIELDLDDGVKVNYAKFQGVEVPKDDGKIVKMDLLVKI
jgi:hypothetical protein